ncbi:hypothetical protein F4780DRAFT_784046 [Xylariomycetidae sp. FL0641]|nr:hypothetical protein F4780DRAFT_784046 [Xylariomycetidae sp. FL0641]
MGHSLPSLKATRIPDDQEKLLHNDAMNEDSDERWVPIELEAETPSRPRSRISAIRSYLWFMDTFLLLIIAALLLLLLLKDRKMGSLSNEWQVGSDSAGGGPTFSTHVVKWEADMDFVPRNTTEWFSEKTLQKWQTLMPAGTGYAKAGETFSTTTMTHELHCLFMMGRIFSGVVSNVTDGLPEDWHPHFLHCIDYLRQGVMCAADIALELHDASDADDLGPLDGGWNGHHVCKDYSQVTGFLESQIQDGSRIVLPIDD